MSNDVFERYGDIIDLPHHVSATRPHMTLMDRAAQFSPFAALTGHGAAIEETARLTDAGTELAEDGKAMLDEKLRMLIDLSNEQPEVAVTCFQPDERKTGGAYIVVTGRIKRIDTQNHVLIFADRTSVPLDSIVEIESEIFGASDI